MDIPSNIEWRWLKGDELSAILPIVQSRGWMLPNTSLSLALAGFDGDELVCFHVLQLIPHAEPMYVAPSHRGSRHDPPLAETMADKMDEFLRSTETPGVIIVADTPAAERMARDRGWHEVHSPVFTISGNVPALSRERG